MSKYESNQDVQPVRVTTYRVLRRAAKRGWELPDGAVSPSLADLDRVRGPRRTERT